MKTQTTHLKSLIAAGLAIGLPMGMTSVAQAKDVSFQPSSVKRLCPRHVDGDREFAGHGPDVSARVRLSISGNKRAIYAKFNLQARETQRDWTTARGRWTRKIYSAPSGYVITRILSNTRSTASYRDNNHDIDRPSVRGGTLVRRFEIMGDTRGNDIGNCTSDDVFMNVYFNRVRVALKKVSTGGGNGPATTYKVRPRTITRLCPRHVQGDREFSGHGPDVRANVRVRISSDGRKLLGNISLSARETKRNWTTARGNWTRTLWTAPNGKRIKRILSSKSSSASYRDNNHDIDRPRVTGGSLVKGFEIMGDTRGNDVGNCTSDDVFMNVRFNMIRLLVQ